MAAMSPGSPNAKLFINYRREDTAPYAGRLYDRLAAHFGADQVFIDIDQIEPGEDFVEVINRRVGACEIAIVSIGPNWLSVTDASGKRRLDAEEDFVRMEIIAALERKIRVIPVLVGGARMPRREDLPEALAPLSRRNAIELSETRFHADVNRLIEAVEKACASPEQKAVPSVAATVSAAEQPPVKSAQTTLITTFIRNMRLNWPVLISWLGAAMMIPRLYLTAIMVSPTNWAFWTLDRLQRWDTGLTILLAAGFALIAVAMAYAIIDVPSIGNVRLSQRRFLWFRQLPLLLASLTLAAWWSVFRNVHGSEPFEPLKLWPKFVAFFVASYLCGDVLAVAILCFRKRKQKAGRGRPTHSLRRLGVIALAAAIAGSCVWVIATRMFLVPSHEFTLKRDCEATLIPSQQQIVISAGTRGSAFFTQNEFTFERDCEATLIQSGRQIVIRAGTHAFTAKKDLYAFELNPVPAPAKHALNYVCFAPALLLAALLLVNFRVTKDEDGEWWGRSGVWILITILGWIVFNVSVLWGAQATSATANQLNVFIAKGGVETSPLAKVVLGAFGGVTGMVAGLLALRHKRINTLGEKAGFQWLLIVAAVVFFVLLCVVTSWVLVLIGAQQWAQQAAAWFLGWHQSWWQIQLFVSVFASGAMVLFGIVLGFFFNAKKRV
jgi:hypothetical protein